MTSYHSEVVKAIYHNLRAPFVLADPHVIRACAAAQVKRIGLGCHPVNHPAVRLGDQVNPWRGRGGHRGLDDAAIRKAGPFSIIVNGMHECELPLAVQGFGDRAGEGGQHAQAMAGKIRCGRRIYADHGLLPPVLPGYQTMRQFGVMTILLTLPDQVTMLLPDSSLGYSPQTWLLYVA